VFAATLPSGTTYRDPRAKQSKNGEASKNTAKPGELQETMSVYEAITRDVTYAWHILTWYMYVHTPQTGNQVHWAKQPGGSAHMCFGGKADSHQHGTQRSQFPVKNDDQPSSTSLPNLYSRKHIIDLVVRIRHFDRDLRQVVTVRPRQDLFVVIQILCHGDQMVLDIREI
jgi:hypothetical protein